MKHKVILVGCGNVGSRHLQALAKIKSDLEVNIVEPNEKAQSLAKSRLNEVIFGNPKHNFFWYKSLDEVKNENSLAIIATNSVGRADILSNLLEKGCNRFLVEKIVCQSVKEYEKILFMIKKNNAKAWVNTNLRYFQTWKKIKDHFQGSKLINFSLVGPNISALATSSIHYIDLFSWFTQDYKVKLSGEFLFDKLFLNKRGNQFVEFAGTIMGSIENGSTFSLTYVPESNIHSILNLTSANKQLIIDETEEKIYNVMKNDNQEFDFEYEYVSTLTTKIVNDILENDESQLSTLEDSFYIHKELFRVLNEHIKKINNEEPDLCPIT